MGATTAATLLSVAGLVLEALRAWLGGDRVSARKILGGVAVTIGDTIAAIDAGQLADESIEDAAANAAARRADDTQEQGEG